MRYIPARVSNLADVAFQERSTLSLSSSPGVSSMTHSYRGTISAINSTSSSLLLPSPNSAYKHAVAQSIGRTNKPKYNFWKSKSAIESSKMHSGYLRSLYSCLPYDVSTVKTDAVYPLCVPASTAIYRSLVRSDTYYRRVAPLPERVLDAPGIVDDFYLHLMDWGPSNLLAVALGPSVYIWNAENGSAQELMNVDSSTNGTNTEAVYISSLSWMNTATDAVLAIGTSHGTVQLWSVATERRLRTLRHDPIAPGSNVLGVSIHPARVASLSWNHHILSSGSRTGAIYHSDVRIPGHKISKLKSAHTHEVCGLSWSPDGSQICSGGNDNVVNIWDGVHNIAVHRLTAHSAAVKAISWCPWKNKLLATGGGTADRSIKTWNTCTGSLLSSTNTGSQVTSLLWSPNDYRELISSHGYADNQIIVWRFPTMSKLTELKTHSGRILCMRMSSDGETVVSVGADETLNFWRIYPIRHLKKRETTKCGYPRDVCSKKSKVRERPCKSPHETMNLSTESSRMRIATNINVDRRLSRQLSEPWPGLESGYQLISPMNILSPIQSPVFVKKPMDHFSLRMNSGVAVSGSIR